MQTIQDILGIIVILLLPFILLIWLLWPLAAIALGIALIAEGKELLGFLLLGVGIFLGIPFYIWLRNDPVAQETRDPWRSGWSK